MRALLAGDAACARIAGEVEQRIEVEPVRGGGLACV
jgi:hypothetical protein